MKEYQTNYDAMKKKNRVEKDEELRVIYASELDGEHDDSPSGDWSRPIQISDLGCAAGLYTFNFFPSNLNRSDPQRVVFEYKRTRDVTSIISAYWENALTVDAQSYFNSIRVLKNRLYASK